MTSPGDEENILESWKREEDDSGVRTSWFVGTSSRPPAVGGDGGSVVRIVLEEARGGFLPSLPFMTPGKVELLLLTVGSVLLLLDFLLKGMLVSAAVCSMLGLRLQATTIFPGGAAVPEGRQLVRRPVRLYCLKKEAFPCLWSTLSCIWEGKSASYKEVLIRA